MHARGCRRCGVARRRGSCRTPICMCARHPSYLTWITPDTLDSVGAAYGSRWSIWDMRKLQGGKPIATGQGFVHGTHRFRYAHCCVMYPSPRLTHFTVYLSQLVPYLIPPLRPFLTLSPRRRHHPNLQHRLHAKRPPRPRAASPPTPCA